MGRPFWNPRSLAGLRQMNEDNLTGLCNVWDMVEQPRTPSGGYPRLMKILDRDVPCRLAPLDLRLPGHVKIAEQFGADVKWIVIFKAGYEPPGIRLYVRGESNGTVYDIQLGTLGEIFSDTEMLRRVACQTLPDIQAKEYKDEA